MSAAPPGVLAAASAMGIHFDAGGLEALGRYLDLLVEANTRFNLTAVHDRGAAWMRHVFDALTLMPVLESIQSGKDNVPTEPRAHARDTELRAHAGEPETDRIPSRAHACGSEVDRQRHE